MGGRSWPIADGEEERAEIGGNNGWGGPICFHHRQIGVGVAAGALGHDLNGQGGGLDWIDRQSGLGVGGQLALDGEWRG